MQSRRKFLRSFLLGATAAWGTAAFVWWGTGLDPWWPLLWFAPVPVLVFAQQAKVGEAALCAVAGWALGGLNLADYYHLTLGMPLKAVVIAVVGPALAFACSVLLFRALVRRGCVGWAAMAFPALMTALEFELERYSPHGTAGSLAYSQLRCWPVLQLASVTGPAGITFLVLGIAGAMALALRVGRRAAIPASAALGILLVIVAGGCWRLARPIAGPRVRVGLVASDQAEHLRLAQPGPATDRQWEAYRQPVLALARLGADVVVLPEKLGTVIESAAVETDTFLQRLADQGRIVLVVGMDRTVGAGLAYNEARVYRPGSAAEHYDKEHLLPTFEDKYTPGQRLLPLPVAPALWGVAICKDLDFPAPADRYGAAGVGLLLVPAWDFDVDRVYHGHMAIMRGVEAGCSIARAAKQGFLTVSDSRGRVLAERPSSDASFSTLMVTVPAGHVSTAYLKLGPSFGYLAVVLAALSVLRLGGERPAAVR
jgi:apolipoprotein N-acyltransferase